MKSSMRLIVERSAASRCDSELFEVLIEQSMAGTNKELSAGNLRLDGYDLCMFSLQVQFHRVLSQSISSSARQCEKLLEGCRMRIIVEQRNVYTRL